MPNLSSEKNLFCFSRKIIAPVEFFGELIKPIFDKLNAHLQSSPFNITSVPFEPSK